MTENKEKNADETDETKKTENEPTELTPELTPEDTTIIDAIAEEEPETKQPDETVLEVTVKEKRKIRLETRTALKALIIILLSMLCNWAISSSDSFTISSDPSAIATAVGLAIALGIVVISCTVWNPRKRKISIVPTTLLFLIFILPIFLTVKPLSKYHNYKQIERDQRIIETLEITVLKDEIKILLPDNYASENSYLKKVFFLNWEGKENEGNWKSWKEILVPCREGQKYWFYVKLPFPEKKAETAELKLFFNHAWKDYEETKEISFQDPNSL